MALITPTPQPTCWRQQQQGRSTEDIVTELEERMLIVDPPASILAKYPALAEAYREYKLVERLTVGYDKT
jgi:hypothetical protein